MIDQAAPRLRAEVQIRPYSRRHQRGQYDGPILDQAVAGRHQDSGGRREDRPLAPIDLLEAGQDEDHQARDDQQAEGHHADRIRQGALDSLADLALGCHVIAGPLEHQTHGAGSFRRPHQGYKEAVKEPGVLLQRDGELRAALDLFGQVLDDGPHARMGHLGGDSVQRLGDRHSGIDHDGQLGGEGDHVVSPDLLHRAWAAPRRKPHDLPADGQNGLALLPQKAGGFFGAAGGDDTVVWASVAVSGLIGKAAHVRPSCPAAGGLRPPRPAEPLPPW